MSVLLDAHILFLLTLLPTGDRQTLGLPFGHAPCHAGYVFKACIEQDVPA